MESQPPMSPMPPMPPMPPVRPLLPRDPRQVADYELVGRLGEGGMGTVFLGRAPGGALVAVKVVRPELAGDTAFTARFHSEVANAERVASFSTAQVLDHGESGSGAYLVTEYIEGPSLGRYLADHGALSPGLLHGVAVGVAAALVAIHGAGLIHRDLKPGNVLLSLSGPRVIDFGIARALDDAGGHTRTGQMVGSPGWIAPEQIHGGPVTTAVDIFTWGCLVAYAGTGTHPFGKGDFVTMAARIAHAEPDPGPLPEPLDRLVRAALSKDPQRRPAARDLLLALVGGTEAPAGAGADGVATRVAGAAEGAVAGAGATAEIAAAEEGSATAAMTPPTEVDGGAAGRTTSDLTTTDRTTANPADIAAFGPAPAGEGPARAAVAGLAGGPAAEAAARETIADSWRPEELAPTLQAWQEPVHPAAGPAAGAATGPAFAGVGNAATLPVAGGAAPLHGAAHGAGHGAAHGTAHGHDAVAERPGRGRRHLVTGGAVLAMVLVAVPLGWSALREGGGGGGGGGGAKGSGPAPLPTEKLVVRVDSARGWPKQCHGDLGILDSSQTEFTVLLPGKQCDILPQLSPDRKKIAFTRVVGDRSQLWVMSADGTGAERLVEGITHKTRAAWAPDGKRLAFMKTVGRRDEIHVISTDAPASVKQLTDSSIKKDDPAWSPDGKRIAFWAEKAGAHQIFTLAVDDPRQEWEQITEGEFDAGDPVWSRDDKKIAYTVKNANGDSDIHVIDSDGEGPSEPVTHGPDKDMDPSFSPDCKRIAFVRGPLGQPRVYAVPVDGTAPPQPLHPENRSVAHPTWS